MGVFHCAVRRIGKTHVSTEPTENLGIIIQSTTEMSVQQKKAMVETERNIWLFCYDN